MVEDNEDIVFLLSKILQTEKYDCTYSSTLNETIEKVRRIKYDAIILDLNLPDSKGLDTLRSVLKECSDCAIIVFTAMEDDYIIMEAIKEGAQDYLVKSKIHEDIVVRSVRYAVERKKNENTLKENANRLKNTLYEKERIENELRESEDKFRYIFEHSIIGKSITSPSGEVHTNKAFCDMLGYSQEELQNKKWQDITHPEDIELTKKYLDPILSGQKDSTRFIKRYLHKNGSIIWGDLSTSLRRDKKGNPVYFMTSIVDITDRKKAEDALILRTYELKESEQKYRAIVDYSTDMIWTVDKDGCYKFLNKATEKIVGYKSEVLIENCFEPLLPKEDLVRVKNIFQNILSGRAERYEFSFVNTKGETKVISATGTPLYVKGKIIGVSNIGRDITEQKLYEKQLVKISEKLERSNKELSEFVHIASHDLQQPIRTIVTYTGLLIDRYKEKIPEVDSQAKEYMDTIKSSSIHMQEMIDDLLALSKIERKGKPFKETHIQKVLEQVLMNLHNLIIESSAKIIIGDMPTIYCDETQFVQLFQNLIDNAIKFSKMGVIPEINISAEKVDIEDKEKYDQEWIFSVSDNGIGISQKNFDQLFIIFNRLHTDEYPGTGIGLVICKKIVERHKGRIWIESELGTGSTFKFSIPIKKQ